MIGNDSKYTISGKLYDLGYKYPLRFRVTAIASKYMAVVTRKYGCTSHLGVLGMKNHSLLIKAVFPLNADSVQSGTIFPLHCSAMGKILLAFQPDDIRKSIMDTLEMKQFTQHTIVNKGQTPETYFQSREACRHWRKARCAG